MKCQAIFSQIHIKKKMYFRVLCAVVVTGTLRVNMISAIWSPDFTTVFTRIIPKNLSHFVSILTFVCIHSYMSTFELLTSWSDVIIKILYYPSAC